MPFLVTAHSILLTKGKHQLLRSLLVCVTVYCRGVGIYITLKGPVIKATTFDRFVPFVPDKAKLRRDQFLPIGSDAPVLCVRRRSFIITSWFF